MKKNVYLIIIILLVSFFVKAQSVNIYDSLNLVIKQNTSYEAVISAYKLLSVKQSLQNFDEVDGTVKKGIELAKKNADSISIGVLMNSKGRAEYFKGSYDSAIFYYLKAVKFFDSKSSATELSNVYNDIAKLYRKTQNYPLAIRFYNDALELYKKTKNESGIAMILNESGVVYEQQNDFKEAINRYTASLKIQEKLNDEVGIGYALNFIGGAYASMNKFDSAETYQRRALAMRIKLNDSMALALNYNDLGSLLFKKGNIAEAKINYLKSSEMAIKMRYKGLQSDNLKMLASLESKQGNFEQAFIYNQQYDVLKDSIFNMESTKNINELTAKYETVKKEKIIEQQNFQLVEKQYWIYGSIALIILITALSFFYLKNSKLRNEKLLQAKLLAQQTVNTRAIIDAEEKERKRIAEDLHDGIGQLFSAVKINLEMLVEKFVPKQEDAMILSEKTLAMVDESCTEVRSIAHQMMPNALIKAGLVSALRDFVNQIPTEKIKVSIETKGLEERLESNTETVLYRVIQESVNNVMKHANATELHITLLRDAEEITAAIEDNGKGFDTSNKSKFEGIGLKNMVTRIEYLKGNVEISSTPNKGTLVSIYIPLI